MSSSESIRLFHHYFIDNSRFSKILPIIYISNGTYNNLTNKNSVPYKSIDILMGICKSWLESSCNEGSRHEIVG